MKKKRKKRRKPDDYDDIKSAIKDGYDPSGDIDNCLDARDPNSCEEVAEEGRRIISEAILGEKDACHRQSNITDVIKRVAFKSQMLTAEKIADALKMNEEARADLFEFIIVHSDHSRNIPKELKSLKKFVAK